MQIQHRNAEMARLLTADLLPARERNVAAEFYDDAGLQSITGALTTLNLDTARHNGAPDVFLLASDVITVAKAGLYLLAGHCTMTVGGSTGAVFNFYLEEDPDTGAFATVPATQSYAFVFAGGRGSAQFCAALRVGRNYRYRLIGNRSSGSDTLATVAEGTRLAIVSLVAYE